MLIRDAPTRSRRGVLGRAVLLANEIDRVRARVRGFTHDLGRRRRHEPTVVAASNPRIAGG